MSNSKQRREDFIRLATKRTNAVLDKLRVLGHCSNSFLYEYTEDDVKKIFKAIEEEVREVKSKFRYDSKHFQL